MALGAKLIAATLILGASTVGTYAIANGGLGGLSSEGDSSSSTDTQGTQQVVPEAPAGGEGSANTGETGVRTGPSADVVPQPAQASVPGAEKSGVSADNPVAQGEEAGRVGGAVDTTVTLPVATEESPQVGSPATVNPSPTLPEGGSAALEPKVDVQGQGPKVVSNVEAEVASDLEHSSDGVTSPQQPAEDKGSNLEGTSLTAEQAAGEDQHRGADADGGAQSNPATKQDGDSSDPSKGRQVEEAPGNTDPNKGGSGETGTEPQNKGASSDQLETTSPGSDSSHTPPNQADNGQKDATLETRDGQNTQGN